MKYQDNIILLTDSYKLSHYKQYPPGTSNVFSYFESRVGAEYDYTVFFGLQYFLRRYLQGRVVTRQGIAQAEGFANTHMGGGFNKEGWEYILNKYDGRLPVKIRAVPEGTKVPTGTALMTVENTDPNCYWLTNYLESLLVQVWYPSTVATRSAHVRQSIAGAASTSGDMSLVDFKLHDFGFRGVSSVESAGIGGLAHLLSFKGTDTIAAIGCGISYYDSGVCGFSIPASEHSTITSWGRDGESQAYANMLEQYPDGLVACVSDSFDIDAACSEIWGSELRDKVIARDGTLVVRPDSGEIVPMVINVLERLGAAFGTYTNSKGYKVLNDKVRVIQGDGCTYQTIKDVISAMMESKWSIDNVAFGMGGGLLQKLNRDTQRFAFKCSSVIVDGQQRDVFKQPSSDPTKNSKRGRLDTVMRDGEMITAPEGTEGSIMRTVFENGKILELDSFDQIRQRISQ